jgi:plastocyanin
MKSMALFCSLMLLGMAPAPQTHVVRMELEDGKFRFEPAEVKAKSGDRIQFVMAGGAPHNVAFDAARIPESAHAALSKTLTNRIQPLAGPLLSKDGATYTITLTDVPAGRYPFFCMPHMSMGMQGVLIVE